nr:MAG TPA: hypothetical protein [Caudoviricetes sp.]
MFWLRIQAVGLRLKCVIWQSTLPFSGIRRTDRR